VLGAAIPPSLGLGFAIPLTFMTIIVPYLSRWPHLVAILVSGSIAVLFYDLPWKLNLIIAAIAGMFAGYMTEYIGKNRGIT
jgi:predicted branched-subunit amino acid permease